MNPKEILTDWLTEHGFDGLHNQDYGCNCDICKDFIPCETLNIKTCEPAYRWECKVCKKKDTCKNDDDGCLKEEKQVKIKFQEGK
jgi:hypothetical protein